LILLLVLAVAVSMAAFGAAAGSKDAKGWHWGHPVVGGWAWDSALVRSFNF
jgi:hypothetical protein